MRRYTNNWQAAPGFVLTKDLAAEMTIKTQYTLPGLSNFYMTGQLYGCASHRIGSCRVGDECFLCGFFDPLGGNGLRGNVVIADG